MDGYLKKGHVGAIVAVAFVIFCVVDKGTVFLWDAITCGNTAQLFLYNKQLYLHGFRSFPLLFYTTDEAKAVNECIGDIPINHSFTQL